MLHISEEILSDSLLFLLPLMFLLDVDSIIYPYIFLIFKIHYAKLYTLFATLIIFTCTVE